MKELRARGRTMLLAERDRRARSLEEVEAARERCRTLAGFVREARHLLEPTTRYLHNWHHDVISEHLEASTAARSPGSRALAAFRAWHSGGGADQTAQRRFWFYIAFVQR
jgi:hypothetical protein